MPVLTELRRVESGQAALLTLAREEKRNALDWQLLDSLEHELSALAALPTLRVVVLTGAGEIAFSAGADIEILKSLSETSARAFISLIHRCNRALRTLPVPVVCRVNGHCIGAGLEIAASCDLRIAVDQARFAMPEVQVGLPSVIEAALLPRLIGWGRTGVLVYTGEAIDAGTALEWGLVEKVCGRAVLDDAVEDWVRQIGRAAPDAVRAQKRLMNEWAVLPLEQAVTRGIDYLEGAYATGEPEAYIERLQRNRHDKG